MCVCAAAAHELDEAEVVQARIRGDVPSVHVHLPLLPRVSVLASVTLLQFQILLVLVVYSKT